MWQLFSILVKIIIALQNQIFKKNNIENFASKLNQKHCLNDCIWVVLKFILVLKYWRVTKKVNRNIIPVPLDYLERARFYNCRVWPWEGSGSRLYDGGRFWFKVVWRGLDQPERKPLPAKFIFNLNQLFKLHFHSMFSFLHLFN